MNFLCKTLKLQAFNWSLLLKFLGPILILACQSARTQTATTTDAVTEPNLPRVSDQKDVSLAPEKKSEKPKLPKSEKTPDLLQNTIKKYSSAESVKMELVKKSKLKMLNRTDEYKGQAFLKGKHKLRLEFTEPQHTIAVLNGARAWVVEYPPKDVDDKIRVSKFSLKSNPGQSQLLITSILSSGNLLKVFRVIKKSSYAGKTKYELEPKKITDEIKSLTLWIENETAKISEIQYLDPIDNETNFVFSKTTFNTKLEASLFEYSVPKDAEINEF